MAITFIYPVAKTGEKSLKYDTENKEGKIVSEEKNDSLDSLNYIMTDKKGNIYHLSQEYLETMKNYISYDKDDGSIIFHTIKSSINCSIGNAYENWQEVRNRSANGNSGNLQYCIVQNFGTAINPKLANKIGMEFAEKYLNDYQVVISTHINTGLVHNHIEFNATSFKTYKKFNDNLSVISDMRKISDELCRKYNLPVLEQTADFNYVLYKDKNGKTKVFEPTERKENANKKRSSNANSYINSKEYDDYINNEDVHIDILKKDIDMLLDGVDSYENLLSAMRDIGYDIKDKTKNGEWRKHISFKLENWGKPVRDSLLARKYGERYLRTNLEKDISAKADVQKNNVNRTRQEDNHIEIVIGQIEEKKKKKRRNNFDYDSKTEIKKYILSDINRLKHEIDNMSKDAIDNIDKKAEFHKMTRDEYLNDCIMKDMLGLKFMENNQLSSFTDINLRVKSLCEKRKECYSNIIRIQENLVKANEIKVAIETVQNIRNSMENNSSNPNYILYEKENDIAMLKMYEKFLKEHGLKTLQEENEWVLMYNQHKEKLKNLTSILDSINSRMKKYDDCVDNIRRINYEYHAFDKGLYLYDEIKDEYRISKESKYNNDYSNVIEKEKVSQEKNKPNIYE